MISKDMYKFLKEVPQYPESETLISHLNKHPKKVNLNKALFDEAMKKEHINFEWHISMVHQDKENVPFYINESGKIAIEEYKRGNGASIKSTWALIISILSLIASIVLKLVQTNN